LAQIGLVPHLAKQFLKFLLMLSVNALLHSGESIMSLRKYPKIGYLS
jgi:hypothetical protein